MYRQHFGNKKAIVVFIIIIVKGCKLIKAKLFEFHITDFEEVYAVIDNEKHRLHISPVNYSFNFTLDLTKDLNEQIEQYIKFGEKSFNIRLRKVTETIIKEWLYKGDGEW